MEKAPDLTLSNAKEEKVRLSSLWADGPVLFVFYPGDFTPVCTAQLCDYQDNLSGFEGLGVKVVGISADPPSKHAQFAQAHGFGFDLLSDPKGEAVKAYGCTSAWTFGLANRAVCLVNQRGEIVWRHVERFAVTRRKSDEIQSKIEQLREAGQI